MLKFTALSGTVSVTENLYVYEYDNQMMIVDCGVGFPDIEMHGVDLVIPDFTYIIKNKHKLKGIIVSQGHEDHQGALPFLLRDVNAPIHAPALTAEFIKDKMADYRVKNMSLNVYDPDRDTITVGPFTIHPFRVAHSVPDTLGFAIDTPEGRIFHVPEHKFDPTPVDGNKFDVAKVEGLAKKDVLFLASDCLGVNKPGSTPTEATIEENLLKVARAAKYSIFFTTISSNIGRIQQAINVAEKLNRKVAIVGRSIERKSEIAASLGYLKNYKSTVIPLRLAVKRKRNETLYIIAGCYGQAGSSLFRLASNDHRIVKAEKNDMVIFSADPAPPYSKESEDYLIDKFIEMGVDVHYYGLKEGLYVSGHGSQDDITKLFAMTNPKYFIPIGGTVRFMHGYRKLAEEFGAPPGNIFELKPGDGLSFSNGHATKLPKIPVKEVLVDGLGIGDVGRVILQDRKTLGEYGAAIVLIQLDSIKRKLGSDPEIISRGFVFEKEEQDFLKDSAKELRRKLERNKDLNRKSAKFLTVEFLADLFYKQTQRRPMIVPVVVEV